MMTRSMELLPYHERPKKSRLFCQETRRQKGDVIEGYTIKQGMDNVHRELLFTESRHATTRGHPQKISGREV